MLDIKHWVINLERCQERLEKFQAQCRDQNLIVTRWPATDGKAVGTAALIGRSIDPRADFLRQVNAAPVAGICDSTYRLWNHLLEIQADWHLVLEDDAVLPLNFSNMIQEAWKTLPEDAEVALLGCDFWQRGSPERDKLRFDHSLKPSQGPWFKVVARVGGAFAYALRSAALPKMIKLLTPFMTVIDNWPQGLNCYLLEPDPKPHYQEGMAFYGIVRCSGAPTTVQVKV